MKLVILALISLVVWPYSSPAEPFSAEARDLAFAVGLYRDGQYRLAEEELANFLRRYPQSPSLQRARLLRADCLVELRRYAEALDQVRWLTGVPGDMGIRASSIRGRALLGLGRNDEAERVLRDALDVPAEPAVRGEMLYYLGWALRRRGACGEALPVLKEAAALDWNGRLGAALSEAWCYLATGAVGEAESTLARLLAGGMPAPLREESQVARGVALLALGEGRGVGLVEEGLRGVVPPSVRQAGELAVAEWLHETGRVSEAEQWYRQAASIEGEGTARSLCGLGWCLLDQQRGSAADSAFDSVLRWYSGDDLLSEARYGRGKALLMLDRPSQARDSFERVLMDHPSSSEAPAARWELAALAMAEERWEDMDAHLAGLMPDAGPAWLRGRTLALASEGAFRRGNYAAAVQYGRQALADRIPEDVDRRTRLQVGMSLVQLERGTEAVAVLDSLSAIWPDGEVWLWLGEALFLAGRYEPAANAYAEALELDGGDRENRARYGRAWALLKLGRWADAEAEFAALSASGELADEALLRRGDALFNQKQYREAATIYDRVSSTASDSAMVREALLRLATAEARAHRPEQALVTLDRLLGDAGSLEDDALLLKGDILFQDGQYDGAAAIYDEVIGLCRDRDLRARAHYRLGDAYYNQGLYGKAGWAYRRFLTAFPGHDLVAHAAEGFLRSIARGETAESAVRTADSLSAHGDSLIRAAAAHAKAGFLLEEGNEAAAAEAYKDAAASYPWSSWADEDLLSAGQLFAKLGHDDLALRMYHDLRQRYADSELVPQSFYSEAEIRQRRGDTLEAIRLLRELRQLAGSSALAAPAMLLEGRLQRGSDRPQEAHAVLTDLLGRDPPAELGARARLELSEMALDEQRWGDARRWAAWVVEQRSDELAAKAQRLMAESFAGEGDWEKAQREFLRVAYLYPSASGEVERAKERAAECEAKLQQP